MRADGESKEKARDDRVRGHFSRGCSGEADKTLYVKTMMCNGRKEDQGTRARACPEREITLRAGPKIAKLSKQKQGT